MEHTQDSKFLAICKRFVDIDEVNPIPQEGDGMMKRLTRVYNKWQFNLYYDELDQYLTKHEMSNMSTKCPQKIKRN